MGMDYKDDYLDWAQDYDLFGEIDAPAPGEQGFLDRLFRANGVRSVLGCACGTGQHLILLSRMNYEVSGSDYSQAMLASCRENLSRASVNCETRQCDYRFLDSAWNKNFDAVICMTQSLNHMFTREDLLLALGSMKDRLRSGGILVLTQGTTHKTLGEEFRFDLTINNRDFTRVMTRDIGQEFQTIHILDIFHSEKDNRMEKHSVTIKIILDEEFRTLLSEAGFSDVEILGDYEGNPYDREESWKLIVVAKKT